MDRVDNDERFEREIEELRRQRIAGERKKKEDEKQELESQKKMQEMQEKKKVARKKGGAGGLYYSYDIKGRSVEIQNFAAFPNLVPKCVPTTKLAEPRGGSPDRVKARQSFKKLPPQTEPRNELMEQAVRSTEKAENTKMPVLAASGFYEAIVLASGVTFFEQGKNPKSNLQVSAEKSGMFNKTEYYSMLGETSMKLAASLPTLFPEISKPKAHAAALPPAAGTASKTVPNTVLEQQPVVPKIVPPKTAIDQPALSLTQRFEESKMRMENSLGTTSDLSQLMVLSQTTGNGWHKKQPSMSTVPRAYVPPSYRRSESASKIAERHNIGKNEIDAFNMEIIEGNPGVVVKDKSEPITRGGKPSAKFLRESLGIMRCVTIS